MAKKKIKIEPESTLSEVSESQSTQPELEASSEQAAERTDPEGDGGFNPRIEPIESTGALAPQESESLSPPAKPKKPKKASKTAAKKASKTAEILAPEEPLPSTSLESPSSPADSEAENEPAVESVAETEPEDGPEFEADSDPDFIPKPRPPAKLERLQKILAAAGIASRRSAEGMIEQGRVQVNGKVVTVLGTKADLGRDHIRVDGKLLQGPERLRYFVLNKPKGFVTTVKDPEGRPTVMQFFEKMKERLYPVGRLDYMSEGLLVVTNDGELANRLTKASSGVEKTYLVKVAGQPTEDQLNILRGGVAIERGKPGSPQVRTSPARIRQVRQGDNPWYEVVLIEGRNRELRKMFEEIGHFVEKIRRTGYGPLVLDQEPGSLRELEPGELDLLRKAAEGKLRTPKAKDLRRRNLLDAGLLPTVLPKPSGRPRQAIPPASAPLDEGTTRPSEFRPKRTFSPASSPARPATGANRPSGSYAKPFRPARPAPGEFRPGPGRPPASNFTRGPARSDDRPRRTGPASGTNRPSGTGRPSSSGPSRFGSAPRPAWKKDERPTRPPARFTPGPAGEGSPATARPTYDRPRAGSPRQSAAGTGRTGAGRPFAAKPTWKKPERSDRPERPGFKRPSPPRRESRDLDADLGPVRPPNLHIEEITGGPSSAPRPSFSRPSAPRPFTDRPRPSFDRPDSSPRSGPPKPFRREGGLARPFTTSSGKPRAGGARPSSKPGSSRPYTPRAEGASGSRPARPYSGSAPRTEGKPAWKPRPSFGSGGKPTGGSRAGSKPGGHKPGGFSKPGYKPKPGGSGPRHTGGKPGGRKRS